MRLSTLTRPPRTTCARTPKRIWPTTEINGEPPHDFRIQPGTYGAGLLQLIDSRSWRDDADPAQVHTAWGGIRLRARPGRPREAIDRHEPPVRAYCGGRQE